MERKLRTRLKSLAGAAVVALHGQALAAETLGEAVLGSWELVSLTVLQGDKRIDLFGEGARGMQAMLPDGRFMNLITRESLPLYAGNNRMRATDEEYRAVGQGSNAIYGTYTVDEEKQEVVFSIEVSTFPNWEGAVQVRPSKVEGGTWTYTNPMTTVGDGQVEVVWKRYE
jgi:hypothetical protein